MPLPLRIDPTVILFVASVVFVTGLLGAAVLGALHAYLETRQRRADVGAHPGSSRRCRYCRLGHAFLHEETVKFEAMDRITTRTYVCSSCGLPQWVVRRVPATNYAEY